MGAAAQILLVHSYAFEWPEPNLHVLSFISLCVNWGWLWQGECDKQGKAGSVISLGDVASTACLNNNWVRHPLNFWACSALWLSINPANKILDPQSACICLRVCWKWLFWAVIHKEVQAVSLYSSCAPFLELIASWIFSQLEFWVGVSPLDATFQLPSWSSH